MLTENKGHRNTKAAPESPKRHFKMAVTWRISQAGNSAQHLFLNSHDSNQMSRSGSGEIPVCIYYLGTMDASGDNTDNGASELDRHKRTIL
jgi:hypothetical protein